MRKWDLVCYDSGEGRYIVIGSFLDESVGYKALDYVVNSDEYDDLGYVDFDLRSGTLFESFEEFIAD